MGRQQSGHTVFRVTVPEKVAVWQDAQQTNLLRGFREKTR
jgi:hypothetical protein